ncbi:hydantoinase/oxoprolinase family protein [Nakamurella sp. YIM 132087]|uniref:Hydantoinase/oxoprolinase family protein n=1 Tax=Nakamurella alba TaxID=2665158 RepID=A0A7K1FSP7_9ACTN|nr:hydantoinase/oxoprolinase family protein [Nakamurella alba]MTD17175.1 hydantoinase/oxoprolinase family protein [Nakamurella alba]
MTGTTPATATPNGAEYRVAVDVGGTFVDAVAVDTATGETFVAKARTTPRDPATGVIDALRRLGVPIERVVRLVHGTTLGLNAILERRGATTGLITNAGFEDILHIGRGDVPFQHMYDLQFVRHAPLIPRRRIKGVGGRLDHLGNELAPLDEAAVEAAVTELVEQQQVTSIAVTYLHGYANPAHEERTEDIVRSLYPGLSVSVSHKVARMYREYERTSSTVLAAYIRPILDSYLSRLEAELAAMGFRGAFWIMRSAGGAMTAESVRDEPLTTVFSGPAGGIAGTVHLSEMIGRDDLLSFDVGGTSLDACVITGGAASTAYEASLTDLPMLTPVFDLRTIGAGGGSIAYMDDGMLRVGPRSAGAEPGPACYQRGGTEPTVTDTAVALGYLSPDEFVVGDMKISTEAAVEAVRSKVAEPLGMPVLEAAAGVFRMVAIHTVGAVNEITIERGLDPRAFSLVAFGGAGPLMGALVMQEMNLAEVVVPVAPGAYSAWGMLMTDLEQDVSRSSIRPLTDEAVAEIAEPLTEMTGEVAKSLAAQGVSEDAAEVERRIDLRYRYQEHTLSVPVHEHSTTASIREEFDRVHQERYGHRLPNDIEIVTLRAHGVGRGNSPATATLAPAAGPAVPLGRRQAWDHGSGALVEFELHRRTDLGAGLEINGPALIFDSTCNVVVPVGTVARTDTSGNIRITRQEAAL